MLRSFATPKVSDAELDELRRRIAATAVSGARLYWENKLPFFTPAGDGIPVVISALPDEIYQGPRSWAERAYQTSSSSPPRAGTSRRGSRQKALSDDVRAAFLALH